MIETTIRDPEKHETLKADSQGRVNLGVAYAGRTVEIIVAASNDERSDSTSLQQTIGDRPMNEYERQGMLFVRLFGIDQSFLVDDHDAVVTDTRVEPETVGLADVDWSEGYLLDSSNVTRFEFEQSADEAYAFGDELTAEPVDVTLDESTYDEAVYCFENDDGGTSAVLGEYVKHVQRIFGYDPTKDRSSVRLHPDEAPRPVMFRDPSSDRYIAIAPRVVD
ncbi:hypothetical protein [Halobaculum limi]|uniref:hypothetical protein n=1 Tax=Halobaculum limi TaxID=3031916 RepID=UPI00240714AF|nr:hypothetical protein [Halobaculum sp. YSMS11]